MTNRSGTSGAPAGSRRAAYTTDSALPEVTDDMLREALTHAVPYTVVMLKAGPRYSPPGPERDGEVAATILRHGKRNMQLKRAGLMPIICPIADGGDLVGIGIFDATPDQVEVIYASDPAVRAGIVTFEVHPTTSFPGSALPRR